MNDHRYRLLLADEPKKGSYMIVRETINDTDSRVSRDRDFSPEYFSVFVAANKRLDELNTGLTK